MNQKGLAERAGGSTSDVLEALGAECRATGSVLVQVSRPHPLEWPRVDSKDVGIASRKLVERTHL